MGARQYDPRLGRFLSEDRVLGHTYLGQSWNRHAYVLDRPLRLTDLDGRFPEWQHSLDTMTSSAGLPNRIGPQRRWMTTSINRSSQSKTACPSAYGCGFARTCPYPDEFCVPPQPYELNRHWGGICDALAGIPQLEKYAGSGGAATLGEMCKQAPNFFVPGQ